MASMPTPLRKKTPTDTDAITSYNKDHRPGLKQTALHPHRGQGRRKIPLYFQVASGNVADDQTRRATWDLLCRRPAHDFHGGRTNTQHRCVPISINTKGRFLTVLPDLALKTAFRTC